MQMITSARGGFLVKAGQPALIRETRFHLLEGAIGFRLDSVFVNNFLGGHLVSNQGKFEAITGL